jgi:hypothetical protein
MNGKSRINPFLGKKRLALGIKSLKARNLKLKCLFYLNFLGYETLSKLKIAL